MNSKLLASLLTACAVLSGAATAVPADNFDDVIMTLTNNSGYTIKGLYLSPVDSEIWGRNVLGSHEFPSGYENTISAPPGYYDLLLVDKFNDRCEVRDIDLRFDRAVSISRMDLLHCQGY